MISYTKHIYSIFVTVTNENRITLMVKVLLESPVAWKESTIGMMVLAGKGHTITKGIM